MNICKIHNKIVKMWFFVMGDSDCFIPDREVSLGEFVIDLMGVIIFPALIILGILFRIYSFIPNNYNLFSNITFKCERNNKEEIYDR